MSINFNAEYLIDFYTNIFSITPTQPQEVNDNTELFKLIQNYLINYIPDLTFSVNEEDLEYIKAEYEDSPIIKMLEGYGIVADDVFRNFEVFNVKGLVINLVKFDSFGMLTNDKIRIAKCYLRKITNQTTLFIEGNQVNNGLKKVTYTFTTNNKFVLYEGNKEIELDDINYHSEEDARRIIRTSRYVCFSPEYLEALLAKYPDKTYYN